MNSNTIVNALQQSGTATDSPIVLTNPGGNNPWLFTWPAGLTFNAGAPVVLEVPCVQAESISIGPLAGVHVSKSEWYADGRSFLVRAVGQVAPNSFGRTLKLYLFAGNGLASGQAGSIADVELGLLSATLPLAANNGAFSNWYVEAKCLWDSASLQLTGVLSGAINGVVIGTTGFSVPNPTAWAAQQAAGSYNPLAFVLGANLALIGNSGNAQNDTVTLNEFTAEML